MDNEIRVVPRLPKTDAVIERKIMNIVRTYDRLKGLTITVAVKTGVVNIRIILNCPSDVLFLKRKVAEIDGVISR